MNPGGETNRNEGERQARRKAAMLVLAHSGTAEIARCLKTVGVPDHEDLREPENGLVMLRGRIGGDGAPFNLGEATVSRAAVRLAHRRGRLWLCARPRQAKGADDRAVRRPGAVGSICRCGGRECGRAAAGGHGLRSRPQGAGDSGDTGRFLHAGARRGISDDDGCRTACWICGQGVVSAIDLPVGDGCDGPSGQRSAHRRCGRGAGRE